MALCFPGKMNIRCFYGTAAQGRSRGSPFIRVGPVEMSIFCGKKRPSFFVRCWETNRENGFP